MFQCLRELQIECLENCFSLEVYRSINDVETLKINVPKLMPLIPIAPPINVTCGTAGKSILVNDTETMPSVSNSVTVTNYLEADRIKPLQPDKKLFLGTRLDLFITNKNINVLKFGAL